MALNQRLDLRQGQSLVMTPRLRQAIHLLQLTNLDLSTVLDTELERNPFLEAPHSDAEEAPAASVEAPPEDIAASGVSSDRIGTDRLGERDSIPDGASQPLDVDAEAYWPSSDRLDGSGAEGGGPVSERSGAGSTARMEDSDPDFDRIGLLAQPETLHAHLMREIGLAFPPGRDRTLAVALADLLDDRGLLSAPEAALPARLGVDPARLARVLARLRQIEPTGLFARDLGHCFALQLVEAGTLTPAMAGLLENLDLVARRDFDRLGRLLDVDEATLAAMVRSLRRLDPRPAARFEEAAGEIQPPDILMRRAPDGGWRIELNEETLPRVLINRGYYAEIVSRVRDRADRDYLSEQLASASWLVKALDQRARTILKVASSIVRRQDAFFRHGVDHMKPLTLRDVAEDVGMHESTVSRVTSGKLMATPRGTFELKYFFTSAVQGTDGDDSHAATAVRSRIKALIDAETLDDVLSDDRLVAMLRDEGIEIARRTVAKYREAMRIPSSVQRRRDKKLAAAARRPVASDTADPRVPHRHAVSGSMAESRA